MANGPKPSTSLFAGTVAASVLSGALTVQTHQYLFRFPKDPLWLKCLIIVLWILDTSHQVFVSWTSFSFTVGMFETMAPPTKLPLQVAGMHLVQPITALLVQLFFCRQLYRLNRSIWPVILVTTGLAISSFVPAVTGAIYLFNTGTIGHTERLRRLELAWLVSGATCDILLSVSIGWSLWNTRSGLRSTDRLITKIILWTVGTGAITALFAVLELLTFMVPQISPSDPLISVAFDIVLAKLYSNSLLAFLNRRHSDRDSRRQSKFPPPDIMMTPSELGTRPSNSTTPES